MNNVIWKEFMLKDIFTIRDGYYNKKPPTDNGNIPFLGATLFNNGVTDFISEGIIFTYDKVGKKSNEHVDKRIFDGNCIAVVNNGTAVGKAYYQKHPFTCSHDVTPIFLKGYTLSLEIALFLIPLLEKSGEPFKYANKWRPKRIRRSKIMLPVTSNNKPDWKFMAQYMEKVIKGVKPTFEFKNNKITDNRELDEVEWAVYSINDLFKIQRGQRLVKREQIKGTIPYISSTAENNGVDNYITPPEFMKEFEGCITIANSGSVGTALYHPYKFVASDHVTCLIADNMNRWNSQFIVTLLNRLSEKYSFNREINNKRLNKEKILLPTKDNKPDWLFMEQYMKRIENDLMKKV